MSAARSGADAPSAANYEEWGAERSAAVAPTVPDRWRAAATDLTDLIATALETVALRVRTGELVPAGAHPEMDDATAVAAALTALLNANRAGRG